MDSLRKAQGSVSVTGRSRRGNGATRSKQEGDEYILSRDLTNYNPLYKMHEKHISLRGHKKWQLVRRSTWEIERPWKYCQTSGPKVTLSLKVFTLRLDLHSPNGLTIQLGIPIWIRIQIGSPTWVWYSTWNSNSNGDKFGRVWHGFFSHVISEVILQSNNVQELQTHRHLVTYLGLVMVMSYSGRQIHLTFGPDWFFWPRPSKESAAPTKIVSTDLGGKNGTYHGTNVQ